MSIGTGIVIAITFEQIDDAPNAEASAERDHEGLENTNSRVEKCHKFPHFLPRFAAAKNWLIGLGMKKPPSSGGSFRVDGAEVMRLICLIGSRF